MQKEHSIIMLPTDKATSVHKYRDSLYYGETGDPYADYKHLYILSDEGPKDGEWCVCTQTVLSNNNTVHHVRETYIEIIKFHKDKVRLDVGGRYDTIGFVKIIATTDKLNIHPNIADSYRSGNNLPQIPESFIKQFVELNGKIDKVMIEYIKNEFTNEYELLINLCNCLNISLIEPKMYNEKQMLDFAYYFLNSFGQYADDKLAHFEGKYLEKWKQTNYKAEK